MCWAFLPGDLNERWSVSVESIDSNKKNEGDRSITVHEGPCEADVATRLYEDPGSSSRPHSQYAALSSLKYLKP